MGGVTTVTRFASDDTRQVWADMNGSNGLVERYVRGEQVLDLRARVSAGGTAAWLLSDRMGSIRNVVDNTGAVIATNSYTGFGVIESQSNVTAGGLYLWDGYRYDAETGLFRPDPSWGRYYGPVTGRWPTRDPIGFGGMDTNLYSYVANEPVNFLDFSGLVPEETPVDTQERFARYLIQILGRRPTLDEIRTGNYGCIGICSLALGLEGGANPLSAEGTRCFKFANFPNLGQILTLQSMVRKTTKCGEGQELRVFAVQYVREKTDEELAKEQIKQLESKPFAVGALTEATEVNPRSIYVGSTPFNFSTPFRFPNNPNTEFWLYMNHGRDTPEKAIDAKIKRGKTPSVADISRNSQKLKMTVICFRCGPGAALVSV